MKRKKDSSKPALHPPVSIDLHAGLDPQKLNQMADDLEVEAFLSTTSRLEKARISTKTKM